MVLDTALELPGRGFAGARLGGTAGGVRAAPVGVAVLAAGLAAGLAARLGTGLAAGLAGLLGGWGHRHGRGRLRGWSLRARGERGAGAAALGRWLQRRRCHLRTGVFRHHRLKYWVFAAVLALLLAPF